MSSQGIPLDSPEGIAWSNAMDEHMRDLNESFRRNVATDSLVALGLWIKGDELPKDMVDDFWNVIGPRIRIQMRPNPNYVPPSMEGLDESGWPLDLSPIPKE